MTAMRRLGFDKLIDAQELAGARPGGGDGGRAHHRAGGEQARHDAGLGATRRWPRTSASPMPTRTTSTRRWTG